MNKHLLDNVQHQRLQVVCAIGAHTQVQLVWVRARFEGVADA